MTGPCSELIRVSWPEFEGLPSSVLCFPVRTFSLVLTPPWDNTHVTWAEGAKLHTGEQTNQMLGPYKILSLPVLVVKGRLLTARWRLDLGCSWPRSLRCLVCKHAFLQLADWNASLSEPGLALPNLREHTGAHVKGATDSLSSLKICLFLCLWATPFTGQNALVNFFLLFVPSVPLRCVRAGRAVCLPL